MTINIADCSPLLEIFSSHSQFLSSSLPTSTCQRWSVLRSCHYTSPSTVTPIGLPRGFKYADDLKYVSDTWNYQTNNSTSLSKCPMASQLYDVQKLHLFISPQLPEPSHNLPHLSEGRGCVLLMDTSAQHLGVTLDSSFCNPHQPISKFDCFSGLHSHDCRAQGPSHHVYPLGCWYGLMSGLLAPALPWSVSLKHNAEHIALLSNALMLSNLAHIEK